MDSDKPTTRFAAEDRVAKIGEELKNLVDRGLISSRDVLSIIQSRLKQHEEPAGPPPSDEELKVSSS
jgi:hypothetical protein